MGGAGGNNFIVPKRGALHYKKLDIACHFYFPYAFESELSMRQNIKKPPDGRRFLWCGAAGRDVELFGGV